MQQQRTRPATAADFHRLADLAHARGLRVFERGSHRWFCTSHSNPLALHVVTGLSCDCAGFCHVGRCTHHAALLAHLGWLPEVEDDDPMLHYWASYPVDDETPVTSIDCASCSGGGIVHYRPSGNQERCPDCGGSGVRVDKRLAGAPAVEIVATAA